MRTSTLLLASFLLFGPVWGQTPRGSISGVVRSATTGVGLTGVNVVLMGTVRGTASGPDGTYVLGRLPDGEYQIVFSMVGFERRVAGPVRVEGGSAVSLSVDLREKAIESEAVVITASRREQRMREAPVTMATVSAAEITDRSASTLDEVLRQVPGIHLTEDQINIRGSSGYSRGVGSRVLLLLDGVPYLTGDTGEINWETIPVHQIERIEVVKGAGSALYGSSALGGVVNVLTREIPDRMQVRFHIAGGLYDRPPYPEWDWSEKLRVQSIAAATVSRRLGSLAALVSVRGNIDESYRENDLFRRWSTYAKLRYDLTSTQTVTLTGNLLSRSHGNYFWWRSLSEATRPADIQLNRRVISRRGNVSLSYRELLTERSFYTVSAQYYGNFWKDDSSGRVENVSTSHVLHGEVQMTYELTDRHILTAGAAGNYDWVTSNLFGRHPGYGAATYVQGEVSPAHNLRLTMGVRFDLEKASVLPSTSRFSPKGAATYTVSPSTVLRASVGTGFRYPSIGELFVSSSTNVSQLVILPNPDLRSESSVTAELGINQQLGDAVLIDASVFNNDFKDLIEAGVSIRTVPLRPGDTVKVDRAVVTFENVTRARIQGMEMVVDVEWIRRLLSTQVGYTYVWPRDLAEDAPLKFRPRHLVTGTIRSSFWDLDLALNFRYASRVERIDDQLVRLAPIIDGDQRVPIRVVDARVHYGLHRLGLPLRVGLNVKNLFNYSYVELIGNLAPIRLYLVSVEGTW